MTRKMNRRWLQAAGSHEDASSWWFRMQMDMIHLVHLVTVDPVGVVVASWQCGSILPRRGGTRRPAADGSLAGCRLGLAIGTRPVLMAVQLPQIQRRAHHTDDNGRSDLNAGHAIRCSFQKKKKKKKKKKHTVIVNWEILEIDLH